MTSKSFPMECALDAAYRPAVLIGCAGWSIPNAAREHFPPEGSHLQRYAATFPAVEINTSFYRPHRPDTYARWRDSVPDAFRFSVKVPKAITHELRLRHADDHLAQFLSEAGNLREKLGCLLVQLPPSLKYDPAVAAPFFNQLRSRIPVPVVCEPRHATWFTEDASRMLAQADIARVIADPQVVEEAAPAMLENVVYIRLHGSPVIYRSAYPDDALNRMAQEIERQAAAGRQVWCIFDNTADGAAIPNALSLLTRVRIRNR